MLENQQLTKLSVLMMVSSESNHTYFLTHCAPVVASWLYAAPEFLYRTALDTDTIEFSDIPQWVTVELQGSIFTQNSKCFLILPRIEYFF
jgi:hypothetical protein